MFEQFLYLGTSISKADKQKVKIDLPQLSSIVEYIVNQMDRLNFLPPKKKVRMT